MLTSLLSPLYPLAQPFIAKTDPERAHQLGVCALKYAPLPEPRQDDEALRVSAFGLDFPNPLGIAAGFDKQGEVMEPLRRLGFGFVEIGGVTPLPQAGNPRPRVFRLNEDQAIINRYGLNSDGAEVVAGRLARRGKGVLGVNLGANKDSADRTEDYVTLVKRFAPLCDFLTVNISSPNTPGLRNLQGKQALDELLARVLDAREKIGAHTAILVKIAPDVTDDDLDDISDVLQARTIEGLVVGNTTLSRPASLKDRQAQETGGLSGKPLFDLSTRVLAKTYLRLGNSLPLIGVGGIDSGAAALAKIEAGASLLQLYSALVFKGPGLIGEIKDALLHASKRAPEAKLSRLRGVKAAEYARG